ncbi:MAG: cyclic-di-AMP receptor [Litorilinea sp.]
MAAVVQIEDATALNDELVAQGLRLTKINSTGGLFGTDSVALLLGLDEARYDNAIAAIESTCKTRTVHMSSVAMLDPTFLYLTPMEVEVGGAVVFCVPVERFVQFPQAAQSESTTPALSTHSHQNLEEAEAMSEVQSAAATATTEAGHAAGLETGPEAIPETSSERMKLILAIVKGDDADEIIRELLGAGHRLTRINTTGGFLRRGNATLLIGVKSSEVDTVINLIESACPRRTEAAPLDKGLPEYSANLFVLDASHFLRI